MSVNVIAQYNGVKKVTFIGDRRYSVRDVDTFRYSGKTSYSPVGTSITPHAGFKGTNEIFTIPADTFIDLDSDRNDFVSVTCRSVNEDRIVAVMLSNTVIQIFYVGNGAAQVVLTGKDRKGNVATAFMIATSN